MQKIKNIYRWFLYRRLKRLETRSNEIKKFIGEHIDLNKHCSLDIEYVLNTYERLSDKIKKVGKKVSKMYSEETAKMDVECKKIKTQTLIMKLLEEGVIS